MMKVPAIEDTEVGLCLAESHAIMRYLCQKYKLEEQWYPCKDLARQAQVNQYLDFHHLNTRKCSHLIFHTLFAPKLGFEDPSYHSESTIKLVKASLKAMEQVYLKDWKYIMGDRSSIADLSAFYEIEFLVLLDFNFGNYPLLSEWMERMRAIKEVLQANNRFYKIKDSLKAFKPENFPKL